MRPKSLLPAVLLAALLATAPLAAAAGTSSDVKVEFTDTNRATMTTVQTWDGAEAAEFRKQMDDTFGNKDGKLDSDEVQRILDATKRDMNDQYHPRIRLNGEMAHVTGVDLSADGLEGPVSSTSELRLTHELQLEFNATEGTRHTFNTTIGAGAYVDRGSFSFTAPPNTRITSVSGFVDDAQPDGRSVSGDVRFNENVEIVFEEGEDVGGPMGVPGPGLAWVLVAGVGMALLLRRTRKDP